MMKTKTIEYNDKSDAKAEEEEERIRIGQMCLLFVVVTSLRPLSPVKLDGQ